MKFSKQLMILDIDDTVCQGSHLYKDVNGILQYCKRHGIKVCIASYNQQADNFIKDLGLNEYIDFIICKGDLFERIDYKKSFLQRALGQFDMKPSNTMFFDDNYLNIQTAKVLGIDAVCVGHCGLTWKIFKQTLKDTS